MNDMGHYDEQYERTEREDIERRKREAKERAKAYGLAVLPPTKFEALGICEFCGDRIYSIPNWKCASFNCPHRP